MPSAMTLRTDYSARELRNLAKRSRNNSQSRRLLSLAAVLDGMSRDDAARIGGMDRQTLRDWVHRFNAAGPEGLLDAWTSGPAPRLSWGQEAELAALVETGPDRRIDGVVRWRRSTSSGRSRSGSAWTTMNGMSERFCRSWASPTSARVLGTPHRMLRPSRRSKKLLAHAECPSR